MELWMVLLLLWSSAGGQDQTTVVPVTCVVMETCVLPCSFTSGDVRGIQWHKTRGLDLEKDECLVHVYSPHAAPLRPQHAAFRGRTSLFPEEMSRGNASLNLTEVSVQDQGTYLCQAITNDRVTEEWIELRVKAPVTALNMEQRGDVLVCGSEDIYPQPSVSWTPDARHQTLLKETQNRLYSVSSSLTFDPLQQYTCNISTHHSWKSATYSQHSPIQMSTNATIPCTTSVSPVKRLVWTFNYIQPIVTQSGADVDYAAPWRTFVKGVSESGSLSLQDLGPEQEGVYVCELHTDSHTHFSRTELRTQGSGLKATSPNTPVIVGTVAGVVLLCVVIIIIVIIITLMWRKHKKGKTSDSPEAEPLLLLDRRKYSREFSLDPNTAHRNLQLSEDYRTVTHVEEEQEYPDHEDRFTDWSQVLSSTELRGRCYWEVKWRGTWVSIAVSYRGIRRRGKVKECKFGLNNQSWSLWICGDLCFARHDNETIKVDEVPGEVGVFSGRVGVHLDADAGTLTFYKLRSNGTMSRLHTFFSSFTEPLFPGFGLQGGSSVTVVDIYTEVKPPIIQDIKKYSREFSLDPNTAHRRLQLSEDKRTVTYVEEEQEYPDHEDRFTYWPQVLSSTGLWGRCYWEVEWRGSSVSIAVSYRGIRRRGDVKECQFGCNDQSWNLDITSFKIYAEHNDRRTVVYHLTMTSEDPYCQTAVASGRVGVFLDSEAGTLTFYKICSNGELSRLHTFFSSFTGPLFLGFRLWFGSHVTVVDIKPEPSRDVRKVIEEVEEEEEEIMSY